MSLSRRGRIRASLLILVLAAAAVHTFWPRRSPSEFEEALRAHAEFVEAYADGDYEEVWEMLAPGRHADFESQRRESGETSTSSAREFFVTGLVKGAERTPEIRALEVQLLRGLKIVSVEALEPGSLENPTENACAKVICDPEGWHEFLRCPPAAGNPHELNFVYMEMDGAWRFIGGVFQNEQFTFKTLERKLEISLPKHDPDSPPTVDFEVTVGPAGLADEGKRLFEESLRERFANHSGKPVVVLDAHPKASIQSVISAREAILEAGAGSVLLAASTKDGPGPGIRVNGVLLGDEASSRDSPPNPDAIRRVITIGRQN